MFGTRRAFPDRSVVETVGTTASPLRFHRGQKPRAERLRIGPDHPTHQGEHTMRTAGILLMTLTCIIGGALPAAGAAEKEKPRDAREEQKNKPDAKEVQQWLAKLK